MENHQSLQMNFKISNKKIKSLWKSARKYLEIIMKHKKCLVKHKMESNKHDNKFSNQLFKLKIRLIITKGLFRKCNKILIKKCKIN